MLGAFAHDFSSLRSSSSLRSTQIRPIGRTSDMRQPLYEISRSAFKIKNYCVKGQVN